jgi:hypothetical protein
MDKNNIKLLNSDIENLVNNNFKKLIADINCINTVDVNKLNENFKNLVNKIEEYNNIISLWYDKTYINDKNILFENIDNFSNKSLKFSELNIVTCELKSN